jgi:hypothetical protein
MKPTRKESMLCDENASIFTFILRLGRSEVGPIDSVAPRTCSK